MSRTLIALIAVVALAGCGGGGDDDLASADSLNRDLQMAPVDSGADLDDRAGASQSTDRPATQTSNPPSDPAPSSSGSTLSSGTSFAVTAAEEISSDENEAGETFSTTVATDVKDSRGRVVIPAGSTVNLRISEIESAGGPGEAGKIVLMPQSVMVGGESYTLVASIDSVEHRLDAGGISTGDAAKVGAGAAAGAIAGRVIGGNSKGAIIGGVVGAAIGTGVAVETKDREVIVPVGSRIVVTLTQDLTIG
ncbi:MAG: glycine zipper domain-containing protein [Gemmatimonadales bacterium]